MPDRELYHYGVKGMRWGVRRFQNKDGSLTSEGKIRYGRSLSEFETKPSRSVIDRVREKIYSGMESRFRKEEGPFEKVRDMKRKSQDRGAKYDAGKVNSKYPSTGSTANCGNCSMAYEMRRRGYDVAARRKMDGMSSSDILKPFGKVSTFQFSAPKNSEASSEIYSRLSNFENGSRGVLFMHVRNSKISHVVNWEIADKKPKIYDSQVGGEYGVFDYGPFSICDKFLYCRLDDANLPDDEIGKHVYSIKR